MPSVSASSYLDDSILFIKIIKLQKADYSKDQLHIQYPLLRKVLSTDPNKIPRYWTGKQTIKGKKYFICSEWYEQPNNNDRPYFERWFKKIISLSKK